MSGWSLPFGRGSSDHYFSLIQKPKSLGRGHVLAGLCPKGMCGLKNSRCEAKIGVKAISSVGG